MSARRLLLVPVLACLGPGVGFAIPIQVDYEAPTLGDVTCSASPAICAQALASLATGPQPSAYALTFDIEESERSVAGSYDVSANLAGSLLDALQASLASFEALGPVTSSPLTASAITQGGLVIDLVLDFAFESFVGGIFVDFSFAASNGGFTSITATASEFLTFAPTYVGSYTITQPPPPPGPEPVVP